MKTLTIHSSLIPAFKSGIKTQTGRPMEPQPWRVPLTGEWSWKRSKIQILFFEDACDELAPFSPHKPGDIPTIIDENGVEHGHAEILSIRVERLMDISEADAIASGIDRISNVGPLRAFGWKDYTGGGRSGFFSPIGSYRSLWNTFYGSTEYRAENNPWCWRYGFKRVEGGAE